MWVIRILLVVDSTTMDKFSRFFDHVVHHGPDLRPKISAALSVIYIVLVGI